MMKVVKIIAVIITGLVFIFSGIVKAIDPLGTVYKFSDYFNAFGLGFMKELALPLAFILFTAEFLAGFSVLTGVMRKTGITVVLLLMIIFTPLTLILAITNPVTDCGCFGDAVHLTNWQTFGKNIILMIPVVYLFVKRGETRNNLNHSNNLLIISGTGALFILFALFNLRYLPVIDFLPYRKGVKIADKMIIPEGAAPDRYETTFIYQKNGERKEFNLSDYPANDSSWIFVEQKTKLISKGYEPPVHDFLITNREGEDITEKMLSHNGFSLLMISKKLAEADKKRILDGFDLGRYCMNKGIDFYVLTASGKDEVFEYENGVAICSADETTLKTMVRSNPGYMLLKDGVITGKWSWAGVPGKEWFGKLTDSDIQR